ncbi:MAG: lipoyl(octanoyl) transferase LipB [Phycisphaerae bacterium]|nr:lipoyl(octanoyl) transferase LipB [Phycisphaerae bacterium]
MTELLYADMGRIPFETGLRLQQNLLKHVRTHVGELAYLILGEHDPPVVTLGVGASEKNIRASSGELSAAGIKVHKTRRGGDVTYHGPGQLVGYPILRLDLHGRDLHRYLRDLEEVLIRTLRQMSIDAGRKKGYAGVWIGNEKVAAIGVAVSRWVTYHGFALNVSPNMEHFDLIVPCGLGSASVTSLERVLGGKVETGPIVPLIVKNMVEIFGFTDAVRVCRDDLCKQLPASD